MHQKIIQEEQQRIKNKKVIDINKRKTDAIAINITVVVIIDDRSHASLIVLIDYQQSS